MSTITSGLYYPRFATVKQNRTHYCLVDPGFFTQRYFTPRPKVELQARECGTNNVSPAFYLFGVVAVCRNPPKEHHQAEHMDVGFNLNSWVNLQGLTKNPVDNIIDESVYPCQKPKLVSKIVSPFPTCPGLCLLVRCSIMS